MLLNATAANDNNDDDEISLTIPPRAIISYPSGRVAVSVSRAVNGVRSLIVLSDVKASSSQSQQQQQQILAVFQSTGRAVVYHPDSRIRFAAKHTSTMIPFLG